MSTPISRRTVIVGAAAAALTACNQSKATAPTVPTTPAPTPTTEAPAGSGAAAPDSTSPSSAVTVVSDGSARFVNHGRRDASTVALTFHASGDPALAGRLLDLLKARSTPVTIFAVGNWLEAHTALAAQMLADGHELANHTYSHQAMGQLSASAIHDEIARCAAVLERLAGSATSWFRPSGIEVPTAAILAGAGAVGYPVSVGYDVDSLDFQDPGAAAVTANVARGVQAGSIVSLHFGHAGTINALPSVLDHLDAVQLQPVTVTQLLA
jgi:peptidoglycan/xylan/chitin deacetylase (PgdA/CDA1 family)